MFSRGVARRMCSGMRMMSSEGSSEGRITDLLTKALSPVHLEVVDTSGGCGAMYSIKVESEMFKGKTLVAQHKMVKSAIAEEIKSIHGLTVKTKVAGKGK